MRTAGLKAYRNHVDEASGKKVAALVRGEIKAPLGPRRRDKADVVEPLVRDGVKDRFDNLPETDRNQFHREGIAAAVAKGGVLLPGAGATLQGLTSEQFNGLEVIMEEYKANLDRCVVSMEDGRQIRVKKENLAMKEAGRDTATRNLLENAYVCHAYTAGMMETVVARPSEGYETNREETRTMLKREFRAMDPDTQLECAALPLGIPESEAARNAPSHFASHSWTTAPSVVAARAAAKS